MGQIHCFLPPDSHRRRPSSKIFKFNVHLDLPSPYKPTLHSFLGKDAEAKFLPQCHHIKIMSVFQEGLSLLSRAALTLRAASRALADPRRADMVAQVGDLTSEAALLRIRRRLLASPCGRSLLTNLPPSRFPEHGSETLTDFRTLPAGTLGYEYARFMDSNQFTPESRDVVQASWDPQLVFLLQRYRDVHDLWHVLTGCSVSVAGEVTQKWFEAVHTGLPVAMLSAAAGPMRLPSAQREYLVKLGIPWALRCGMDATDLLAVRYEHFLECDVDELRQRWNITKAPRLPSP